MNWNDVLQLAQHNLTPPRRVEKTDEEWKQLLTEEQYRVTRQHGTEKPFSGEYCELYSPGIYNCVCCGTELFDSTQKFNSLSGWPSFTEPVQQNVMKYRSDRSFGMQRIEVLCSVCDAHLGHVFPDGPPPSGLRFCINSASLKKHESDALETATLGSGCFWCSEALFNELNGVAEVVSGYAGGKTENPTYKQVTTGDTGHAEVVQLRFDPKKISYADLLRIFFVTHNPTTLNRQGADVGTQYRSIILFHNEAQQLTAREVINEMQEYYDKPIVTEVAPYTAFYKAEAAHQNFYRDNPDQAYCQVVITPKLQKLRANFTQALKKKTEQI
ncbi:MAG TPA: bifunctional methionine sulfoxide reductase B/A protein [Chitinophaga sp.]